MSDGIQLARSSPQLASVSISSWDERHFSMEEPFMSKNIQKNRQLAFMEQKGCCCYCEAPMWLDKPEEFAVIHGIKLRQVKRFRCTAEHLDARKDDGSNVRTNIAAACWHCNSRRHRRNADLSPEEYRKLVRRFLDRGSWHPKQFHHML